MVPDCVGGTVGAVEVGSTSSLAGKPQATGSLVGTVYVVDDDKGFLRSMDRLLRTASYAVRTFTSAQEFLSSERSDAPACLLLDLRMPGVSGIDLQERLMASGEDIPIVFLSGHAEFQSGVRAIMLKGASLADLHYDALALVGLMVVAMAIAVTRFRRTLD